MDFNLKDFKKYCFQEDYTQYNYLLDRIQLHIHNLYKNNITSINERNCRLSDIYKIVCDINNLKNNTDTYNDIDSELNDTDEYNLIFNELILNLNLGSYNNIYKYVCELYLLPKNTHHLLNNKINKFDLLLNEKILYPLYSIKNNIIELAEHCGLENLYDIIYLYDIDIYKFSYNDRELLDLYKKLYIPIHITKINNFCYCSDDINIIKDNEFYSYNIYVKQNNDDTHEELLDNNYNMYIIQGTNCLKITGYFKLDPLQINIRLMPIELYKKIYNKKKNIENGLSENEKFKRKYLKYCSIQELITMSSEKFKIYLDNKYKKFNEHNNKSFPSLMKEFIGRNMNLINWYEIIKLLLLGSEENINVAGSLYSLLRDKKTNISLVPDIIYDNLVFCNQMKLRKINQTLKIEMDKLNELNMDSIDHKKKIATCTNIPLYVRALAMEKINEMKLNNNDYYKQLTYVKTISQYPWLSNNDDNIFQVLHNNKSDARKFLKDVDNKLNTITYGHKNVKTEISLEITKWISNPNSSGTVLGLLGPPGVGKTLIAKSLSVVLDIPMVMITLGGQNDGDLLIGHGFTYSGAQPGLIIKKMCEAGNSRCIMFFDELDKSCSKHGSVNEITSILIHLTDPNTNKAFQDRFFQGIDFPLNKVIFIFSYNDSNKIDPILLDRIKELEVKSYNIEDKINILRDYIIPEIKQNIGFTKNINFNELDMKNFIYDFTTEAGVRDLKNKMEQVLLHINKNDIMNEIETDDVDLTYDLIVKYLGEKNKNHRKLIPTFNKIGHINGLYATSYGGGGITSIEISSIRTGENFQLLLTGSMGDVMKESIRIAFTNACNYIEKHNNKYNILDIHKYVKDNFPYGFHIHTPEGATPKDGPSAGTAFTVGFISAILNIPIDRYVAMTGETNLSLEVTKIGGLIYKLIGAKYAGVKLALIPKQNNVDIDEIIKSDNIFDENFKYEFIDTVEDAIKYTLVHS